MELNKVYNADLFDIIDDVVEDKSIDLGIFDPPYNISSTTTDVLKYEKSLGQKKGIVGFNEEWDKFDSIEQYITWTDLWLQKAFSKLKDDGSLSWAMLRKNIRYINVETRLGYLTKQKEMLSLLKRAAGGMGYKLTKK